MAKLQIGHIELFVKDAQVSKHFYRNVLGFELVAEQSGGLYAWLKCGNIEILVREGFYVHSPSFDYESTGVGLVLYTDDLKATKAEFESRGLVFQGYDSSQTCPTFKDPDGYWWQLAQCEF